MEAVALRDVPLTTKLTLRPPHCEHTRRLPHVGTGQSAPYRAAISAGSGAALWRQSLHQTMSSRCALAVLPTVAGGPGLDLLYPPELRLTRQKGCVGAGSRVADIVVGDEGTTMCALAIRDDISPEELRRRARQESDGRVAARLIAIANALEGMERARRGWPGWTGRPCVTGSIATTRKGLPDSATDRRRGARQS